MVGHNAILHGCTLEYKLLVGKGSIVMNGGRIQRLSVLGGFDRHRRNLRSLRDGQRRPVIGSLAPGALVKNA